MKVIKIENREKFFCSILKKNENEVKKIISEDEKNNFYSEWIKLNKKNGTRDICIINKLSKLYVLQKELCYNFLDNIMLSDSAYGFRKGTNYIEYLLPHISFYKNNFYLRLDIKDFFGSIKCGLLRDIFEYYFIESENLSAKEINELLDYLIEIVTYRGNLVQGATVSPVISNVVFRSLDIRIERYCRKYDITYTRYADDMLFSSENKMVINDRFIKGIALILKSKGFELNYKKTIKRKTEISLGGYVISDSIRLSRKKLSNLNRILFFVENNKWQNSNDYFCKLNEMLLEQCKEITVNINCKNSLENYLTGQRAFIISVLKYCDEDKYYNKLESILNRIENLIYKLK